LQWAATPALLLLLLLHHLQCWAGCQKVHCWAAPLLLHYSLVPTGQQPELQALLLILLLPLPQL
jgi:hypothetical protein